ncbi:hypothetical protein BDV96DRAFT_641662 [Lophiotrema nucula]|uniref:Tyrosinase copper-binding domain-containing protein n=1 Tax=Lophiotrema nucula TaxID=690887 RepID=A0A6A5ZPV6_9PLEO|nr:hypothetical protein BDV96DRAFT_641662 [Lophiotrema nucula]
MFSAYKALPYDELPESAKTSSRAAKILSRIYHYTIGAYLVVTSLALLFIVLHSLFIVSLPSEKCQRPMFRREWRTFDDQEKKNYIEAVQCLKDIPSKIGTNYSIFEDFPYAHAIGDGIKTHGTARFLPWHRYFLHIYEQVLQDQCGYRGGLPYWDWTLDWQHILKAPVWGAGSLAFGTNGTGDTFIDAGVLQRNCVVDGAFANTTLHYLDNKQLQHCLSRGFNTGSLLHNLTMWLRPKNIETLLLTPRYEQFNEHMERYIHLAIPAIVQGDFVTRTSPNDPLTFLHHAQLDRLWWLWQHLHPHGMSDYGGAAYRDAAPSASRDNLQSIIRMSGLAPDIRVAEVMNTRTSVLCYSYN